MMMMMIWQSSAKNCLYNFCQSLAVHHDTAYDFAQYFFLHSESQLSLNGSWQNLHTSLVWGQAWKPTFSKFPHPPPPKKKLVSIFTIPNCFGIGLVQPLLSLATGCKQTNESKQI